MANIKAIFYVGKKCRGSLLLSIELWILNLIDCCLMKQLRNSEKKTLITFFSLFLRYNDLIDCQVLIVLIQIMIIKRQR